jgi:hypothetical protein
MQPLFNGCAEFDVIRRHLRCDFAALEEAQDSVDPSEVVHGFASFCALRGGALSSSLY